MKRVVQLLIVTSIGVSLAAFWGFWRSFVGYNIGEAFNNVLPHPLDPTAKATIRFYGICFIVAVAVTFRLLVMYRQNYREK
jgi:hypothetical protein